MKKRQFFGGLSWLLLLNLLIKPVWIFFIDRQVQNTVGHEAYGTYFALFNLSYVLLFIADAGLNTMMVQQLAHKKATGTAQLLQIKLGLLVLYAAVCCTAGWVSAISEWNILIYLIFLQASGSLLLFFRSLLVGNQLFKTDSFFSVADKSLVILLCSVFIYGWLQPVTLRIFLQLQLLATLLVCTILFLFILQQRLLQYKNREKLRTILSRILPFATIILLMGMHYRLDGFLLERWWPGGALQAGIYATAYRLLDAANMIGYLTASFLLPFITRNKEDRPLIQNVVSLSQHALLSIAIAISCFVFVFAPWIQEVLYHTNSPYNNRVIQLCMAALPAYYLTHIYGSVLTATSRFRTFIFILLAAVLLNVVLNFFLIPNYGAAGSSVAALVSQYTCAFGCYYSVSRMASFSFRYKPWAIYGAGAMLFILVLSVMKTMIHSVWIILAAIAMLVFITAFIQRRFIKTFFRSFIQ